MHSSLIAIRKLIIITNIISLTKEHIYLMSFTPNSSYLPINYILPKTNKLIIWKRSLIIIYS